MRVQFHAIYLQVDTYLICVQNTEKKKKNEKDAQRNLHLLLLYVRQLFSVHNHIHVNIRIEYSRYE